MEIWALCYFLYGDRRDIVVLSGGGGGGCPAWKNQRWYPLKFKNQYHFQYDTTKSLSISEVINNNKIINLNSILLIYSHNAFC